MKTSSRWLLIAPAVAAVLFAAACDTGVDPEPRRVEYTASFDTVRTATGDTVISFGALNGQNIAGTAGFVIDNEQFTATVNARGLAPDMVHPQHIHTGGICPPPSADVNGDGYVDVLEGAPFYGAILIPLDSDLSSQPAGDFPMGSTINYTASVPLFTLLDDLTAADPDTTDAVVKLQGSQLNLLGRIVVLHGVPASTNLPSTVATLPGLPANVTLPVACAVIE